MMADAGVTFDPASYLSYVVSYYTDPNGPEPPVGLSGLRHRSGR